MIPVSSSFQHRKNKSTQWQQDISDSFKNLDELLKYLNLDPKECQHFITHKTFPIRVTQFYADLIKKGDALDPLLLQIVPQNRENSINFGYESDPVGDLSAMKHPGLIHKYYGRALLSLTSACGIHCRYCFRREFPYSDNIPDISNNSPILNYLNSHSEIHEIILSGGDPLMLSDKKFELLLHQLSQINHIKTIRIHSRMPSILPNRITHNLLDLLAKQNKQMVIVLHINHPNEINTDVIHICKKLREAGVILLNQSVLLKNINESVEVLEALSHKLFTATVLPYYLHCLDKVQGTAHFNIDKNSATTIMDSLKNRLPGYLVPKLVQEIPKELSKTAIYK